MIRKLIAFVAFLALIILTVFYGVDIIPYEPDFYTRQDIQRVERFIRRWSLILGIPASVLYLFFKLRKVKSLRGLGEELLSFVLIIASFFFIAEPMFSNSYLFLNRQRNLSNIQIPCIVNSKFYRNSIYYITSFRSIEEGEFWTIDVEVCPEDYTQINQKDTVLLQFQEGWFGLKHTPEYLAQEIQ